MSIQNALASVAVKDIEASTPWYEQVLEARATHPMPELSEWHFDRGGGLQVYELTERAGSCSATLAVDDLDAELSKLERLRIPISRLPDSPRFKVAMIKDPDGNSLAFAQALTG
jgi:predicted enzyme related to lactoylglutathione lyase